ncbi:uncharacterized protein LOC124595716 [Schistocerca americana]|uniref:uncharacterized protein LOC124595716 n=1 Tax=Schistocerca americana TaxID=7009 RepID=UPI001F4FBF90|nr:uncharacterized protein LOC124595716 [Schistocerca americana]
MRRRRNNKREPNSADTTTAVSTGSNRGNSSRSDVGRTGLPAAGGRMQTPGGRGGGGGGGGRRGRNKMAAQQQGTSTPTQLHNRTPHTVSQKSSLSAPHQKSRMEKKILSDFMPDGKFNQKNDSPRKSHKVATSHNVGKKAAEGTKSSRHAELILPTKQHESGSTLPTARKEKLKINVPQLTNSSNRCGKDNIGHTVPELMADKSTKRLEHSRESYAQTVKFPVQTRTQPEELDLRASSVLELGGERDIPEPTSPAYSDNDCSFMTYSSDGISVIISNGGCVLHDEPHSIVPHTAKSDLEKLGKALCIEIPKQDNETDDGVKSVKSISPVYTPGSTCPELTFSGSPPLLNSLDSISPVDSAWSSRTLSPISYECNSPAVLTKTASTAATSGSVVTTTTPTTPICRKIPSSNSTISPANADDTWLWLPAIIPPLTLLLRWIWFPAPPPNLPWRDPVLKENEKAALTAHYYLRGPPPDPSNIQCIEGRWKKDPYWRWIPSNGDVSEGGHWYELPTPPEPAQGAWYLVWPAELPMSTSPFIPGHGTWLTGTYYAKNNLMPTMLLPQKNLPLMYM